LDWAVQHFLWLKDVPVGSAAEALTRWGQDANPGYLAYRINSISTWSLEPLLGVRVRPARHVAD
jgi:hypothetical protein